MRYSFDPECAIIVVEVKLEGEEVTQRVKMALDTGATYTMIPWKMAEVLGLRPEISDRKIDITTASGVEAAPLVLVNSASCGTKDVDNLEVVVHDLPERSHVDGLLGLSFLRNFDVRLNFKKGVLVID